MPRLFHVCFNDVIAPLAVEADELVAEWETDPPQDFRGWGRYLRNELYALVFPGSPPDAQFLLRRLQGEEGYPAGDALLYPCDAEVVLRKAGISTEEPLEAIERRLVSGVEPLAQGDADAAPPERAPDFEWIKCHLGKFQFSRKQRPVVRLLWEDWERDGCGVGIDSIRKARGDAVKCLRDVFKNHRAEKTLITSAGWGLYRLNLPRRVSQVGVPRQFHTSTPVPQIRV
ncbi:hypothetical protein [Gemmata sp.]|uniref:hypothetical protein n=1 Tax=Gemmata sp. TaxID=1914242 RepID=UPI003F720662